MSARAPADGSDEPEIMGLADLLEPRESKPKAKSIGRPRAPAIKPPPAIKGPPPIPPLPRGKKGDAKKKTLLGMSPPPKPKPTPAPARDADAPVALEPKITRRSRKTMIGSAPVPRVAAPGELGIPEDDDDGERTVMRGSAPIELGIPEDDDDGERTVMRGSAPIELGIPEDDDDGERTVMRGSAPIELGIPEDDDDGERTVMRGSAPIELTEPDDERTVMRGGSGAIEISGEVEDDQTVMRDPGAPEVGDDDLTQMQGSSEIRIDVDDDAPKVRKRVVKSRPNRLADTALPKGTVVGRYVVVERIGTGGMGSVYAAYDPELDRKVAVKVLHSSILGKSAGAEAHGRLLREAQALAKLSHPAVVTVHDVGLFREQVFMAMEFVDGSTLKSWMKSEKRHWREVLEVLTAAGEGLAAAHAADLIHRDFKPTNVLLSEDGRVRVLDFGLARRTEYSSEAGGGSPEDSQDSARARRNRNWQEMLANGEISMSMSGSSLDINMTQVGAVMGSPAYMAPEQHMGQPTEPRTDQFSFCVTLYEALYGTRPYVSEDARMMIYAIMEGRLHKPPRDSGVPGWLRKVILRGLSPKPDDRYPSMDALLADLARDPGRRLRRLAMVLGGVVLLGGLVTVAAWPYLNPPEISEAATARIDELANAAHEAAAKQLFVYPPPDQPDHPTAYGKVQELEQIDDETKALAQQRAQELRAEFAATLVGAGDRYWEKEGGKTFAIDYYAQALMFDDSNERASERASLTVGQLASLRRKASDADFSKGELVAAKSLAVLADTDEERKQKNIEQMIAEAKAEGRSLTAQAQLEELAGTPPPPPPKKTPKKKPKPAPEVPEVDFDAEVTDEQPSETTRKATRDPKAAREIAREGRAKLDATQWKEAERLFNRALDLDRRCSSALIGLSDLHFDRSEYSKALTYAERAVASAPKNAGYRIKLGDVYYKVLRYSEAKKAYEAAAELGSPAAEKRLAKIASKLGG